MCTADIQVDVVVPIDTKYLGLVGTIGEEIAKELDSYKGDRDILAYHLKLVLTEAMTNAIEHSNNTGVSKTVRVNIQIENKELCIRVYDQGQGFNLDTVSSPDLDHPKERGFGIFFIRKLMDSVCYNRVAGENILEMRKRLV